MHHATQAYKKIINETAPSRELEANLLLKSAARIQSIHDSWDGRKAELPGALLFNRKLWTFFLDSVLRDENPLPVDVRRNVYSLGIFVINRTIKLTSDPKPDGLASLVNINRELAAGLLTQAQRASN